MEIDKLVEIQRKYFLSETTLCVNFRIESLKKLKSAIKKYEQRFIDALKIDLNKSSVESYLCEIGIVYSELDYMIKHVKKFNKVKKVPTPLMHLYSKSYIYKEPYGVVLIMAPWNYPIQLTLIPLLTSIAAGNCSIVKPSNYSPTVSKVIYDMLSESFDECYIATVLGGREQNTALLNQRFDYIFFTGSVAVGKVVMEAASKHLTPVTLELGGKSPVIVDETANIKFTARRLAWGKYTNAGQTCVAPDYLYVHESVKAALLAELVKAINEFYTENGHQNQGFPRIITEKHFDRLCGHLTNGVTVCGGIDKINRSTLQIAPTILDDITWNDSIMSEEIFGPILPVLTYNNIDELVTLLKQKEKPLALYLFSNNKAIQKKVINSLSFGGASINDTLIHITTNHLPFGGVGNSGMGQYHGEYGYATLTHLKPVLKKSNAFDIKVRYAPYTNKKENSIKKFMKL